MAKTAPESWTTIPIGSTFISKDLEVCALFCEEQTIERTSPSALADQIGCPVVCIFGDSVRVADKIQSFVRNCKTVTLDAPVLGAFWLWTPVSTPPREEHKTRNVIFAGNVFNYPERREFLSQLQGVEVFERNKTRSYDEYMQILCSARAVINFAEDRKTGLPQLKGRVFEALHANAMLLEQANPLTDLVLHEDQEFKTWDTIGELKLLVDTINKDGAQGWDVAHLGHQAAINKFTSERFWQLIESIGKGGK